MRSRDVWSIISTKLKETNPEWKTKTSIQCENKWKDIKRKYMETKDHNRKSGNGLKTCKFYEKLEEILGETPTVKPVAIASNLKKRKIVVEEQNYFEEDYDSPTQGEGSIVREKEKIKMTRVQRELKDWSAGLLADAKIREEARERRHKEIIAASQIAVDAYKEMFRKLIDKL